MIKLFATPRANSLGISCVALVFASAQGGAQVVPPVTSRPDSVPIVQSALDHFLCYPLAIDEPVNRKVVLLDQFYPNGMATEAQRRTLLCNPVRKNGTAVAKPRDHH